MAFQEDKKFFDSLKNRDTAAFERFLVLYEKSIYNYVMRLVRRREDAEDLTQDIFLKVYRHCGLIDPEKNIRAWLYRIATNTCYSWLRKKEGRQEVLLGDDLDEARGRPETFEDPFAYYIKADDIKIIERALDRLKPVQKSVILLYYQQGFSYQEIAEMLEINLNTLKTHLSRAKQALKKILADEDLLIK